MTERVNGWLKFMLALIPFAVAFLVGWGALNSRVAMSARAIDLKADRAVVDVQYQAILRELQALNVRLDRMEQPERNR